MWNVPSIVASDAVTPEPIPAHASPAPDMVWIPGGECVIGSNTHYPDERPARRATVEGFWIDRFPVTNDGFARFVASTGYVTSAERAANRPDSRGAIAALFGSASLVFAKPPHAVDMSRIDNWWAFLPGADWQHPQGPDSSLEGLENHPVVHVAYADVEAYAAWRGQQLPTEAEWEFAARGGLDDAVYPWGDTLLDDGRHMANTWQGRFPYENLCTDGYEGTSPVDAFPANGYGVQDMIGNVWEWTCDRYRAWHGGPLPTRCRVLKGGSHLCAPNYSRRYRPAARYPQAIATSTSHVGFRCIVRPSAANEALHADG